MDEYLAGLDASARAAFERVRDLALELVPQAEQGTSYGMATLRYRQRPLLAFRAAKGHLSVFPFSARVVEAVRDQLPGFDLAKGTIRFSAVRPLPDEVVRAIVHHRMEEIDSTC